MNPLTLFVNAVRAMAGIPRLLAKFIWHVIRGDENAIMIIEDELPTLIFLISPVVYVALMITALVTLLTSGGIQSMALEVVISLACNIWIFVTISLGLQSHDTRLMQAQSIQYYLLFVAFMQTLAWVVHPDNLKNEPSSVFVLFMATSVAYINEKVIKPTIEKTELIGDANKVVRRIDTESSVPQS